MSESLSWKDLKMSKENGGLPKKIRGVFSKNPFITI
jgi:hypothetical protein